MFPVDESSTHKNPIIGCNSVAHVILKRPLFDSPLSSVLVAHPQFSVIASEKRRQRLLRRSGSRDKGKKPTSVCKGPS